jgi:hypothetical protein
MNPQELVQVASQLMSRNQNILMAEAIDTITSHKLDETPEQIQQIAYDWISPYLKKYMIGLMRLILANQDTREYLENRIIPCWFRDLPDVKVWTNARTVVMEERRRIEFEREAKERHRIEKQARKEKDIHTFRANELTKAILHQKELWAQNKRIRERNQREEDDERERLRNLAGDFDRPIPITDEDYEREHQFEVELVRHREKQEALRRQE